MPVLASLIATLFGGLFEYFAKRLTVNLALVVSLSALFASALAVVKTVIFGCQLYAGFFVPPAIMQVFNIIMPDNLPYVLSTVWIGDAVISGWGYWSNRIQVLYQIGKG